MDRIYGHGVGQGLPLARLRHLRRCRNLRGNNGDSQNKEGYLLVTRRRVVVVRATVLELLGRYTSRSDFRGTEYSANQ